MSTEPLRPPEEALMADKTVSQIIAFPALAEISHALTATAIDTFSLNGSTQRLVFDIDARTHIGGRESNQDTALVVISDSEYGKAITLSVIDGMGGHFGGEIAAAFIRTSIKTDASFVPNITNPELYLQSAHKKLAIFKEAIRQAAIQSLKRRAMEVAESSISIMAEEPAPLIDDEDDTKDDLELGVQSEEIPAQTKYELLKRYIDLISESTKLNITRINPYLIREVISQYDAEFPGWYVFQNIRDKIFPIIASSGLRVCDIYANLAEATKEMENGERILGDMLASLNLIITGKETSPEESIQNINKIIELEQASNKYEHPGLRDLIQIDDDGNYHLITGEMGAAATVMSVMGQYAFFASVGDCSIYGQHPETKMLRRYTVPDTVGELIRTNPDEYLRRNHNKPNAIDDLKRPGAFDNKLMATLDGSGHISPRFGSIKLVAGMRIFLATDGCPVTEDLLSDEEEVFETSRRLVRDKPVMPGDDNRTLVSISIKPSTN